MPFDSKLKALVDRVLGDPDLYPDAFKAWLPRMLSQNVNFKLAQIQLPTVEGKKYIGVGGSPAFGGTWVNYGSGFEDAGFYKDPFQRVFVDGLIKLGTIGTVAFTLPVGYRPKAKLSFTAVDGTDTGRRVDVTTNGDVTPVAGNTAYFSLSNITFRAYG